MERHSWDRPGPTQRSPEDLLRAPQTTHVSTEPPTLVGAPRVEEDDGWGRQGSESVWSQ